MSMSFQHRNVVGLSAVSIWTFILFLAAFNLSAAGVEKENASGGKVYLEATVSKSSPYCFEPVVLDIFLYSETPDIKYAEPLSLLEVVHGDSKEVCGIFPVDGVRDPAVQEKVGKSLLYKFNVGKFVIVPFEPLKLELKTPAFRVGIPRKVLRNDPFWGEMVGYEIDDRECLCKNISLKTRKLPEYKGEGTFSGCVGEFTINSYLPPGKIMREKEATFVVEVEGYGWMPEGALPDYRQAFGKTAKLRSVTENRDKTFRDSSLYSELELVCEFMPEGEAEFEVGPVGIVFFNPKSGKYETLSTEKIIETYSPKKSRSSSEGELMDI